MWDEDDATIGTNNSCEYGPTFTRAITNCDVKAGLATRSVYISSLDDRSALINVATGLATIEPELEDVLRALGASSSRRTQSRQRRLSANESHDLSCVYATQ
jgi:hypothetical protein